MSRPVRGNNNNRGGGNARQGAGRGEGEGRPQRRERPARKPFFTADGAEGASAETGARPQRQENRNGGRPQGDRPQRDQRRNEEFRGQRRGEDAPRAEADSDLASTSDFRGGKKQFGAPTGEGRPARSEQRKPSGQAGSAAKPGENRGPVRFGNDNRADNRTDNRGGGYQGRKRSRA